jgi:hypothetical protein
MREWLVASALAVVLSACGLPGDGEAEPIEDSDVPYGLMDASQGMPRYPPQPEPSSLNTPRVMWIDAEEKLVPVEVTIDSSASSREQGSTLLTRLSQGPSESDRARGLGTALTPDANVYVVAAVGPGIVIELDFGEQSLSAERLPLAVGQIVLTATSVPDVEQVRILSDGEPLEVPLPGGALTDGPLRQSDYSELLADAATNSPATGR